MTSPCSGGASGCASRADGLVRVALPLVAVTTTLAWILVGLPAVVIGDRLNRRTIAMSAALLRTVLLARSRRIAVIALWGGTAGFAGSLTFAVLALYLVAPGPVGLHTWGFCLLMASLGSGGLIGALLTGRLAARVGELRLLAPSCALMVADSVVLALTSMRTAIPAAPTGGLDPDRGR